MTITGSVLNVEFQWTIHTTLIKPMISIEPGLEQRVKLNFVVSRPISIRSHCTLNTKF